MDRLKRLLRLGLIIPPALAMMGLVLLGAFHLGRLLRTPYADAAEALGLKQTHKVRPEKNPWPISTKIIAQTDISKACETEGKLVQVIGDGRKVTYTIAPKLQSAARKILRDSELLAGALVMIDVRSGRILTLAEYRSVEYAEETRPVYFSARPPAASLFKIITASALLVKHAAAADTVVCYHGGSSKLLESHIDDDPGRDKTCASLSLAMGKSINPVFAKLADKNLSAQELEEAAAAFGFGEQIPLLYSAIPEISKIDVPVDRLEFARTAAGFWHANLSPLHAAMIAQAVANGGRMLGPILVEQIEDASGKVEWKAAPGLLRQCTSAEDAEALTSMMVDTVTKGTARRHFVDRKGLEYIQDVTVAGKTGSLSQKEPYRFFSWFIGFAPADEPQVAVASLAVNGQEWTMKGASVARELLAKYFFISSRKGEKNR
jgi:peptidoglycan glycosyltransferase